MSASLRHRHRPTRGGRGSVRVPMEPSGRSSGTPTDGSKRADPCPSGEGGRHAIQAVHRRRDVRAVLARARRAHERSDAARAGRGGLVARGRRPVAGYRRRPVAVSPSTGSVLSGEAGRSPARRLAALHDLDRRRCDELIVRDVATEDQLSSTTLRGDLAIRVASDSGNAVALMAPLPDGVDPWTPVPRARTTIVVADPSGARASRTYRPARQLRARGVLRRGLAAVPGPVPPGRGTGRLSRDRAGSRRRRRYGVHGRFKTAPERMPGIRLRQVFDRTTSQLYTLYSTDPREARRTTATGGTAVGRRRSSHVLNLVRGWAYCAGLPRRFWESRRPRRRSRRLRTARGSTSSTRSGGGRRHEHEDASIERSRRSTSVAPRRADVGGGEHGRPDAVRGLGGRGRHGLRDRHGDAHVAHRWPVTGTSPGSGSRVDGLRLYVALDDGVTILDSSTGQEFTAVPFQGIESILHVGTLRT